MAVAFIALLVALGGTSYAVIRLPTNSVGSKQLKRNAVTASKIRSSAVSSSKVKDFSLIARDFKPGELPRGPQGASGVAGATGRSGPRGPSDAFISSFAPSTIPTTAGISSVAEIDLPAGTYVVFANTVLTNNSTDSHTLNCGVGTPGASSGADNFADAVDVGRVELEGTGGAAKQTLALTGAIELAAPDTVSFDCFSQGATSGSISSEDADIGAIQVEALNFP